MTHWLQVHIGVNDMLAFIHGIDSTVANVYDIVLTYKLLHDEAQQEFGELVILALTSGMSISTGRAAPGSLLNGLVLGRGWMPTSSKTRKSKSIFIPKWSIPSSIINRFLVMAKFTFAVLLKTIAGRTFWQRTKGQHHHFSTQ